MPDLNLLLYLQVVCCKAMLAALFAIKSQCSIVCVVALYKAEAGPLVCRGDRCEGKAMLGLVFLPLQFLSCKAMLAAFFPIVPSTNAKLFSALTI